MADAFDEIKDLNPGISTEDALYLLGTPSPTPSPIATFTKRAVPPRFTTPSEVFNEEYPLGSGLIRGGTKTIEEAGKNLAAPGILGPTLGALQATGIHGTALGEEVGTAAQAKFGAYPFLGGPSGVIPAAAGAVTGAATNVGAQLVAPFGGVLGGTRKLLGTLVSGSRAARPILEETAIKGIQRFLPSKSATDAYAAVATTASSVKPVESVVARDALPRFYITPESEVRKALEGFDKAIEGTTKIQQEPVSYFAEYGAAPKPSAPKLPSQGLTYKDADALVHSLQHKVQELLNQRVPNSEGARHIQQIRQGLINDITTSNPGYRAATQVAAIQGSVERIVKMIEKPPGGDPVTGFKQLLQKDSVMQSALTPAQQAEAADIMEKLGSKPIKVFGERFMTRELGRGLAAGGVGYGLSTAGHPMMALAGAAGFYAPDLIAWGLMHPQVRPVLRYLIEKEGLSHPVGWAVLATAVRSVGGQVYGPQR